MQPTIDFIMDICTQAGGILKDGYGKVHQVEYKGPIDLVTEVDKQAEALLVERILSRFPNHSIIAEESGHTHNSLDHDWYIDPVDGTSNYARGLPIFCVSVAYAFEGQMQLAGVFDPLREEFFHARKGEGAFLNRSRIKVSEIHKMMDSILVTGFQHDPESVEVNIRHFTTLIHQVHTIRRLGSAVLDQVYVAAGRMDGYWETGLGAWDIAAGTLIIEEAGGLVTTMKGDPDFMKPPYDILAANPVLHPKLLAELHKNQAP